MDTNGREMEDPAAARYHLFYSRFFASIRGFLSSFDCGGAALCTFARGSFVERFGIGPGYLCG
jgi:hypothetical protein